MIIHLNPNYYKEFGIEVLNQGRNLIWISFSLFKWNSDSDLKRETQTKEGNKVDLLKRWEN